MYLFLFLADIGQTQAMVVAVALIACIAIIMVAAIIKYPVQDVIKIWSILGVLTGLVTGSIGSYFFTKPQLDAANQQVESAQANYRSAKADEQQISSLSNKVGLENLASLPPAETTQLLHSINLNTAATQPAEWKSNLLQLHKLTSDKSKLK